jgi:hypothetical protein
MRAALRCVYGALPGQVLPPFADPQGRKIGAVGLCREGQGENAQGGEKKSEYTHLVNSLKKRRCKGATGMAEVA